MGLLVIDPGAGHKGVALHAGIGNVRIDTLFILQPVEIIVRHCLVFIIRGGYPAVVGHIAVMELDIVEAQLVPHRMYMHFTHALGVITGLGQFTGHGGFISPVHAVLIANPAIMFRRKARHQRCPGGNAAGASGVGIFKKLTFRSQGIQIRGFYIRMTGITQAISPKLVCHQKQNISFHASLTSSGSSKVSRPSLPDRYSSSSTLAIRSVLTTPPDMRNPRFFPAISSSS